MINKIKTCMNVFKKDGMIGVLKIVKYKATPYFIFNLMISLLTKISTPKFLLEISSIPVSMFYKKKTELLKNIVILNFKEKINVLEIGSWFGEGSTKVFLNNLLPGSNLYIVDSWKKWLIKSDIKNSKINELVNNLYLTAFHNLINVVLSSENSGRGINTSIIRGDSELVLNNFKGWIF